jgi:hypothetical protein
MPLARFKLELGEESAQFQHRSNRTIRHQRARAVALAINLPRHDRRTRLALHAARAGLTLITLTADLAFPAQQLPPITGADARIRALANEGSAIERDDIERLVSLPGVIGAADIRRSSITAIAASARDTDPIYAARNLRRVPACLPGCAIVANKLTFIGDALRAPNLCNRQSARHRLEAIL